MTRKDYPALFSASDMASATTQNEYFRLLGLQLLLLVVASGLDSVVPMATPSFRRTFSLGTAVVLAVSVILMWILLAKRSEKIWFDCRAVAESVKTTTWRYLMHAPPYESGANHVNVDAQFLSDLSEIRRARPGIDEYLAGADAGAAEITDYMRRVRALPVGKRREFYLQERLLDQRTWYEDKARACRRSKVVYFWVVASLQVIALTIAMVQSAVDLGPISVVSILMTIVATCLAWAQAKRYEDLVNSYALASQELRVLESLAPHLSDVTGFQRFVADVEDAISREHTMWSARRSISMTPQRR